jgi:Holliday junction resolvase RusA-like endonuclease
VSWSFSVPGQPPSWNHAYERATRVARDGRRYSGLKKTAEAEKYQRDVALIVGAARPSGWTHGEGYLRLRINLFLGHDIDATNVWKILEDAIARKLGIDDKWFLPCFEHKEIGVKQPRVEVTIDA